MSYSRNDTSGTPKSTNSNSSATVNSTQTSISNTSGSQSSSSKSSFNSLTDYLDPVAREALNKLLKSFSNPDSAANQYGKERLSEINKNQQMRGDYSKSAAFADAIGAMNSQLAKSLEAQMPAITAGIDSAGTSGSAMSALLTQKAAENAANTAAELGLQAAISYGQIQTGFSNVLEQLTAGGDPAVDQLLGALNIAKGSIEKKSGSASESSSGTSNQTTVGTTTTQQTSTEKSAVKEEATPWKNKTMSWSGLNFIAPSGTANSTSKAATKF